MSMAGTIVLLILSFTIHLLLRIQRGTHEARTMPLNGHSLDDPFYGSNPLNNLGN